MKTIVRLNNLDLIQTMKMTLGAHGIEAFIPDEVSASVDPFIGMAKQGIRLQVPEKDAERAIQILEEHKNRDSDGDSLES
ncbi:MAG: DUF2007 domain-containing protein [Akkermansiaceae bacterium]